MRKAIAALAIVFLAAHVPFLPPTLEDLDSINFALGVRHFDVAQHQPHPPGYPVLIGIGKASTAALRAAGVASPESRGLAVWSALCGAALILPLFALFLALDESERRAWWTTVVVALSPLFWFTALRPLSDTAGLAAAVLAQSLIASAIAGRARPRVLTHAALVSGLAIGIRSQTFLLTLPLLALALVWRPLTLTVRDRLVVVAAFAIGVVAWGVPLIVASGGLSSYAAALGSQAGEDLSGVVMLWNMRQSGTGQLARVGVDALTHTFLWPWGHPIAGSLVVIAAVIGCVRVALKSPRALGLIAVGFVPYAIFHLLFHEVVTTRYALPLVVPVAFFVVRALDLGGMRMAAGGTLGLAAWSLWVTLPASVLFGSSGSPTFRAFQDVVQAAGTEAQRPRVVAMHAVMRRAADWVGDPAGVRMLKARHGHEWLALVDGWRSDPSTLVSYVADPRRTDLALIDPVSRRGPVSYRWPFVEPPFVGGARPGNADVYAMRPPGWMLDRGWAITAEIAGVTAKDGDGPHVKPSVAWIRTRPESATLLIGGRHLSDGAPPVRISLSLAGAPLDSFDTGPGYFFRRIELPPGSLGSDQGQTGVRPGSDQGQTGVRAGSDQGQTGVRAGSDRGQTGVRPGSDRGQTGVRPPASGYLALSISSNAADGSTRQLPLALEQFDLQSPGVPMIGAESGWYEPEYNPRTAQAWRWTSDRAALWVRPVGRSVTLTLSGESPLRYFDSAPTVIVAVGPREIARFSPAADFTQSVVLSADALAAANGEVTISSDKVFVPAERGGPPDRRHLALRIYSYSVK